MATRVDPSFGGAVPCLRRQRTDFTVYGSKRCEATVHVPLTATVSKPGERARHLATLLAVLIVELEDDFGADIWACLPDAVALARARG